MNEVEYYAMCEDAEIGKCMAECAKAIFDAHNAETMAQLQRTMYKYTEAGIAISFELHSGSVEGADNSPFVYCGDQRAAEIKEPWNWIRAIGVSSIVEGSDVEVPLEWIDLMRFANPDNQEGIEGDQEQLNKEAVRNFDALCEHVDEQACELWEEANGE